MPEDLTEVDQYPAAVPVPLGGDARTAASVRAAFQNLTDRSKHHELHKVETVAFNLAVSGCHALIGSGLTNDGDPYPLSIVAGVGSFSSNGTEITVPSVGFYLIGVSLQIVTPASSPFEAGFKILLNDVEQLAHTNEWFTDGAATTVTMSFVDMVNVLDVAHKIKLTAITNVSLSAVANKKSKLILGKFGPQVTP